jgi:hypothetical protein
MRLLFLAMMVVMSGCATQEKYQAKVRTWLGSTEESLVAGWGVPVRTHQMSNGKVLEYQFNGGSNTTAQYNESLNLVTSNTYTNWCTTSFTINSIGVVESYRFQGNSCVSD